MKIAPLHRALEKRPGVVHRIVHTGQHSGEAMSRQFFRQLQLPEPHVHLELEAGTPAGQIGRMMVGLEKVLYEEKPDQVIVVGDVNSTLAGALTAVKCGVLLNHIEAGLRSFDRTMPEEINRILTDQLSDRLFVTENSGIENLGREGIPAHKIFFSGNLMIDTLVEFLPLAARLDVTGSLGVKEKEFALITLHRPANVDKPEALKHMLELVKAISLELPVVFPLHPRTRQKMQDFGLFEPFLKNKNIHLPGPLGYLEFLSLLRSTAVVVTDSGGIQEESTFLGVPCLTLRSSTERPASIEPGTNTLAPDPTVELISGYICDIMEGRYKKGGIPPMWDGKAAERVVDVLLG